MSAPSQPLSPPSDARHALGRALGRIPSGVYLLIAGTPDSGPPPMVMMVSWVQQAAFDPPAVTLSLAKGRPISALLAEVPNFVLCVLGQKDTGLMKKYARGYPRGADPFDGVPTLRTPSGAIYFADALAYMECRVLHRHDFGGDHETIIAEVLAGELLRDGPPFTHLRGNGFHY